MHRKEIFHCFAISKFMKSTVLALEAVFKSGFDHQKLTKTKVSPNRNMSLFTKEISAFLMTGLGFFSQPLPAFLKALAARSL